MLDAHIPWALGDVVRCQWAVPTDAEILARQDATVRALEAAIEAQRLKPTEEPTC